MYHELLFNFAVSWLSCYISQPPEGSVLDVSGQSRLTLRYQTDLHLINTYLIG